MSEQAEDIAVVREAVRQRYAAAAGVVTSGDGSKTALEADCCSSTVFAGSADLFGVAL